MSVNLDKLQKRMDELEGKSKNDEKKNGNGESPFFKPEIGGAYTLRMIPYKYLESDEVPIVVYFQHALNQSHNKDKLVFCPRKTLREDCTICKKLSDIWNGTKDEMVKKAIFKATAPRMFYVAPVLVYNGLHEGKPKGEPKLKIWSMQKATYRAILETYSDPDYGTIHDVKNGVYLSLTCADSGKKFKGFTVKDFTVNPKPGRYALTSSEKKELKESPQSDMNIVEQALEFRGPEKNEDAIDGWMGHLINTYGDKVSGVVDNQPEGFKEGDGYGSRAGGDAGGDGDLLF